MAEKPPERSSVSRRDLLTNTSIVAAASRADAAQAQPAAAPVRREAVEGVSATEADVPEAFSGRLPEADQDAVLGALEKDADNRTSRTA